jgi:ABC transporter DrrB family efflux protein
MVSGMIEVEDLTRSFGTTHALAGVSLSVRPGEVVGLLGPNGAGKTTLVRAVATLLRPDGGSIRVCGVDVAREPQRVRSLLGLAGQAAAVDALLTGRENLELVGRLYGLGAAERRRRADEVLERFDLVDAADRRAGTYSGGMRRRLDLGATLVGRPAVMLLDEPTAGLDPRSRNELWALVDEVAADGTTVLLTSQHLEEVERLADRIVVIDEGVVIADGSGDELKRAVGGDVLEARVVDVASLERAMSLLGDLGSGEPVVDRDEHRISIPTRDGVGALVTAARRLDDATIELADLGLRHPSLDDVFFALTGDGATRIELAPSSATDLGAASAPPPPAARHTMSDLLAISGRYVRRMARTPQVIVLAVAQPIVFVLMLDAVFGGIVSQVSGDDYIQFLVPGVLVMNIVLGGTVTSGGIAEDIRDGIIDRFRSLPMSRAAVLVGRTIADLSRTVLAATGIVTVGVLMGYRPHGGVVPALGGLALLFLFTFALSWLFALFGMLVKEVQAATLMGFLVSLPLVYLSGAWIPVDSMSGALKVFARNQPVNVLIDAARAISEGAPAAHHVWSSIAWSVGILAVCVPLAVRRYRGEGY